MKPGKKSQMKLVNPNPNSQVVAKATLELSKLQARKVTSKRKQAKKKGIRSSLVPPVQITLDGSEFTPVLENNTTWVMANVPVTISGNRQIALSHRNSATIDCGITVKVPDGFKLVIELSPEHKDHGLEVYKSTIIGESRVSFSVRNLGREIAVINHRDRVASLRIEPIYSLTFKVKNNGI